MKAAFAAVVTAGALAASAAPAVAADQPTSNKDMVWVAGDGSSAQSQGPAIKVAQSAPVWAVACNGAPRDKIVRGGYRRVAVTASNNSYYTYGGTTNLTCGFGDATKGEGYLHLADGHGQDWQNLAYETGENWRDVADAGIVASLGNPDYATYRASNDTMCYSSVISLVNKSNGQVVDTKAVRVVVPYQNPAKIITSFPAACSY